MIESVVFKHDFFKYKSIMTVENISPTLVPVASTHTHSLASVQIMILIETYFYLYFMIDNAVNLSPSK